MGDDAIVLDLKTPPFTQTWADALRDAINCDVTYRETARGWNWPLAFVLEDGAPVGLVGPVAVELTLEHGVCLSARIISPDACTAKFVFRAPYEVWRQIIRGELDPVGAVINGAVALTGSMSTLIMNARAVSALVRCARSVPTDLRDDKVA